MIYFLSSLNIKTSYYTTRQNVPSITLSLHFFTFSFNISIFINHHNIYPTPHGNSLIPHNSLFFIIKALNGESFLFICSYTPHTRNFCYFFIHQKRICIYCLFFIVTFFALLHLPYPALL